MHHVVRADRWVPLLAHWHLSTAALASDNGLTRTFTERNGMERNCIDCAHFSVFFGTLGHISEEGHVDCAKRHFEDDRPTTEQFRLMVLQAACCEDFEQEKKELS